MSLVKCKECGQKVSTRAKACPTCGAKPPKRTSITSWFILFLVLFGGYSAVVSQSSTPTQNAASVNARTVKQAEVDQETKELIWMERGKDAIRSRLKDPESVKFKNVYFHRGTDGLPITCGQVNSKNSLGGYGGFQHFVSAGAPKNTVIEDEVKDFHNLWNKLCTS